MLLYTNSYLILPLLLVIYYLMFATFRSLYQFYCLPKSPSLAHWAGTIVGHRGTRTQYVNVAENSLMAFEYAYEHGANAVECDVQLTLDGKIVVMHDGTVDRVCHGVGEVSKMTFASINALNFRRLGIILSEGEVKNDPAVTHEMTQQIESKIDGITPRVQAATTQQPLNPSPGVFAVSTLPPHVDFSSDSTPASSPHEDLASDPPSAIPIMKIRQLSTTVLPSLAAIPSSTTLILPAPLEPPVDPSDIETIAATLTPELNKTANRRSFIVPPSLAKCLTATAEEEWKRKEDWPITLLQDENVDGPPSLEQVIRFCRARSIRLIIEIKEYANLTAFSDRLLELFRTYPHLYETAVVATFNPVHIYTLRSRDPNLPVCWLYCSRCLQWYYEDGSKEMCLPAFLNHRVIRYVLDLVIERLPPTSLGIQFLGLSMVGPHAPLANDRLLKKLQQRGIVCNVWGVNDIKESRRIRQTGGMITSDETFEQ